MNQSNGSMKSILLPFTDNKLQIEKQGLAVSQEVIYLLDFIARTLSKLSTATDV